MTQNENRTTICLETADAEVFRKLSMKTKISIIDLMHEIAKEINVMLEDGLQESSRISFMPKCDLAHSMVLLYFAPIITSFGQLPPNAQEYYKKLRETEDGTPETAKIVERTDEVDPKHMAFLIQKKIDAVNSSTLAPDKKMELIQELQNGNKECPEA